MTAPKTAMGLGSTGPWLYHNHEHPEDAAYTEASKLLDVAQGRGVSSAAFGTLESARMYLQRRFYSDPASMYCSECLKAGCRHAREKAREYAAALRPKSDVN